MMPMPMYETGYEDVRQVGEFYNPAQHDLVDDGLGQWAALVGGLLQAAGSVYSAKEAGKAQKSAQAHDEQMLKLENEMKLKQAQLMAASAPRGPAGGGGIGLPVVLAGVGGVIVVGGILWMIAKKRKARRAS